MNKSLVTSVVAAAGLAVSGFSFAASAPMPAPHMSHWYAGIGINYYAGFVEDAVEQTNIENLIMNKELDRSNVGGTIFVGNQLTKHFAAEGGFNYYGNRQYKYKATSDSPRQIDPIKQEFEHAYSVYMDGIGRMPLGHGFSVFAKAGVNYFYSKMKVKPPITRDVERVVGKTSDKLSTIGIDYGGGLQYDYQQFGIRAAYTAYKFNKHSANFTEPSYVNLDVMYHFS